MKRLLFLLLAMLCIPGMASADELQTLISFRGEIVDQDAAPVSGILPLEFRVFTDSKAKKVLLTEQHFVSVVDGSYTVVLGENGGLPGGVDKLTVAVYMDKKELTKQEVKVQSQVVSTESQMVRTSSTGGSGGNAFQLTCPAGYVVTGIEGTENGGIQSLKLVCSKTI